jgi:hypothetical protein
MQDGVRITEGGLTGVDLGVNDAPRWSCVYNVKKEYHTDCAVTGARAGDVEWVAGKGNTLMNGGASVMWERLITIAASTGTTGGALQAFSTGNAALAVGISTAAAAVTQTDLQAATGSTARWIQEMESGYPSHSDGTSSSGARECQFRAVFSTTEGNFAWQEWAVFNDPNSTGMDEAYGLGRMLNRKVQSLGTKTTSATWTFTATLGLS